MAHSTKPKSSKVAIISINRYSIHMNYGAALHSYAFQQTLDKLGYDNHIVDYAPSFIENYNIKYPLLNRQTRFSLKSFYLRWILGFNRNIRKYNKFESFFRERCRFTERRYRTAELDRLGGGVDTYICESDVIWKITSTNGVDDGFFLNFQAAREGKRISYSPSIGRYDMAHSADIYSKLLQNFDYISTREVQSADYLTELLRRPVEYVLDPTLLLDREEYSKIAKKPSERDYVLLYNCMSNDKAMVKQATKFAKSKGLQLIEISSFHENRLLFPHTIKDDLGVEEFLGYFEEAKYIICNGFHGACFALVFNKEFTLFQRDKSDYRMTSLVDTFNLQEFYVKTEHKSEEMTLFSRTIDYNAVTKTLSAMQERSFDYLRRSLEGL